MVRVGLSQQLNKRRLLSLATTTKTYDGLIVHHAQPMINASRYLPTQNQWSKRSIISHFSESNGTYIAMFKQLLFKKFMQRLTCKDQEYLNQNQQTAYGVHKVKCMGRAHVSALIAIT